MNKKEKGSKSYGIIGLGRFGLALAKTLAEAGKEVVVVDNEESSVREIRQYTEYAYVSKELTKEVLQEIGMQNCDVVVICIGEKIDTSILTTLNVVSLGVPQVIAKAVSQEQGMVLEKLGARVVYPERDMALRLAKRLLSNSVLDYIALSNDIEISEICITGKLSGRSIVELDLRKKYGLNIIAVEHAGETITDIDPEYRIVREDIIVVIGNKARIAEFEAIL